VSQLALHAFDFVTVGGAAQALRKLKETLPI